MSCFCLLAQKEGCWDPSLSNFLHELLGGNVILLCTIYGRSVQGVSHYKKSAERLQSRFRLSTSQQAAVATDLWCGRSDCVCLFLYTVHCSAFCS